MTMCAYPESSLPARVKALLGLSDLYLTLGMRPLALAAFTEAESLMEFVQNPVAYCALVVQAKRRERFVLLPDAGVRRGPEPTQSV